MGSFPLTLRFARLRTARPHWDLLRNIITYAIDNFLVRIQYDLSRIIVACGDDGETVGTVLIRGEGMDLLQANEALLAKLVRDSSIAVVVSTQADDQLLDVNDSFLRPLRLYPRRDHWADVQ